jgi:transporter family-2 protein
MMFVLLTVLLGAMAVIQATINRQIAVQWGLSPAVLLNTFVATVVAAAFLGVLLARGGPAFLLKPGVGLSELRFHWHWLLPGVFGFFLVAGLPWAVHHIGALRVFVGVVAAQMVTSLAWDHFAEGIPASAVRGTGALLAVASVVLVSWR